MGIQGFVQSVLTGLPVLIAVGAGCVLAVLYWKRCPRPALFALLAGGLALVEFFLSRVISFFVMPQVYSRGGSMVGFARAGTGLLYSLLLAAAFGLLFYAVFEGRAEGKSQV